MNECKAKGFLSFNKEVKCSEVMQEEKINILK